MSNSDSYLKLLKQSLFMMEEYRSNKQNSIKTKQIKTKTVQARLQNRKTQ